MEIQHPPTEIENTLASPPKSRTFTKQTYLEILAMAKSQMSREELLKTEELLIGTQESLDDELDFPEAITYDAAERLGIPSHYIEQAIRTTHPTPEEQFQDLTDHRAVPTLESIVRTYQHTLLRTLKTKLPHEKFEVDFNDSYSLPTLFFYKTRTRTVNKKFFMKKWKEDEKTQQPLAHIYFEERQYDVKTDKHYPKKSLNISLYHPQFLSACGEELKTLNTRFQEHIGKYTIDHSYVVEL